MIGALKGVYHELDIWEPGGKVTCFGCIGTGIIILVLLV